MSPFKKLTRHFALPAILTSCLALFAPAFAAPPESAPRAVDITVSGDATRLAATADALRALGPDVAVIATAATESYGVISARVAPDRLAAVAALPGVVSVSPVRPAGPGVAAAAARTTKAEEPISPAAVADSQYSGSVGNSAAMLMGVGRLRAYFPQADGRGIRIGVVADSVGQVDSFAGDGRVGIAESQASGDLPASDRILVLRDDATPGTSDKGRAMLEHIHDIAPGAAMLGFASGSGGQAAMADAIQQLSITGAMDIIADGQAYQDEPIYQDGVIAQALNAHTDRGLYFAAAGNSGNFSHEAIWADANGDFYHDFDQPALGQHEISIAPGQRLELNLFWAEPWGTALRDFDLELVDYDNEITYAVSAQNSTITRLPYDQLVFQNASALSVQKVYVRLRLKEGGPTGMRFKIVAGPYTTGPIELQRFWDEYFDEATQKWIGTGSGAIVGHAGAVRAIAIGAMYDTATYSSYTSFGPHRRLYNTLGQPDEGTLQKPDFAAIDAAKTTFYNYRNEGFRDTAAAAANAAGIAALVLQLAGGPDALTQAQMRQFLRLTSVSSPPLSHNNTTGFGRMDALVAGIAAAGPQPTSAMLIPNQFGDVTADLALANDSTLGVYRFAQAGGDFVHVTSTIQPHLPVQELLTGNYAIPVQHVFDGSSSPFKVFAYGATELNFTEQTFTHEATCTASPTTPTALVEVSSARAFVGSQDFRLTIDGPSYPLQRYEPAAEGERAGFLSADAPIAFYEILCPADQGPGFTVEVSSQDADIVLAAFDGFGNKLQESAGASLTSAFAFADVGFILAVTSRNYASFGNYTIRVSFESVAGLPRTIEFGDINCDYIPNPVTGLALGFGNLGPAPDGDAFAIRTGGGVLNASVTSAFPDAAITSLGVYLNQARLAATASANLPSVQAPTAAGDLYVVYSTNVAPSAGAVYNLRLETTPATPLQLALAPNVARTALEATHSGRLRGIGDYASYRFVNPIYSNGQVEITVENTELDNTGFDPAYLIYDEAGVIYGDIVDDNGPLAGESYTAPDLVPGATYYVQVVGHPEPFGSISGVGQTGDYRLTIRAHSTTIPVEPEEPNNTQQQAFDLAAIMGEWSDGTLGQFYLWDTDFFRVTLAEGQNSLTIYSRTPGLGRAAAPSPAPVFRLRDSSGNLIATSGDSGGYQGIEITGSLAAGEYVIEVPGDNSGTAYSLIWIRSTVTPSQDAWFVY